MNMVPLAVAYVSQVPSFLTYESAAKTLKKISTTGSTMANSMVGGSPVFKFDSGRDSNLRVIFQNQKNYPPWSYPMLPITSPSQKAAALGYTAFHSSRTETQFSKLRSRTVICCGLFHRCTIHTLLFFCEASGGCTHCPLKKYISTELPLTLVLK